MQIFDVFLRASMNAVDDSPLKIMPGRDVPKTFPPNGPPWCYDLCRACGSAQCSGWRGGNGTSLLCGQLQINCQQRPKSNKYINIYIYYLILDDISIVYFLMSNNHRNVWVMPCHIWKKIQRHRHGIQPFGSMAHLSGNDRHISYLRCVLIGKSKHPNFKGSKLYIWLVVSTQLKNISQDGNLPQKWNHHLVMSFSLKIRDSHLLTVKFLMNVQLKKF